MANVELNQAQFARTFAEDIASYNRKYLESRSVLVDHQEVPKAIGEEEWYEVVNALTNCSSSVKFFYKIAMLVESKIITNNVFYILYYNEITGYLTEKLSFLIRWCGTGLRPSVLASPVTGTGVSPGS